MKKLITIILIVLTVLSCGITAFAEAVSDKAEIPVNAKAQYHIEGQYPADLEEGGAVVTVDDGTTITVTNAPNDAARLIVTPIPASERSAWTWITGCFKNTGTPVHTFDIYFVDESGSRINANGAVVTIDCTHCSGTPMVCSLTTEEKVTVLDSTRGTFTTDGSHYYVLAEKTTEPDEDDTTDVQIPVSGDTSSATSPLTGDNGKESFWIALVLISGAVLVGMSAYKQKKHK